ncbi:adenylate kinase [Candidatus Micrarchaeota archaeon]|nr:adenylate kinase [Candidatus Micrarchaeota archaeon]
MRIILLGAPGSGKGTQAVVLAKEFDLQHVSTGDLLRAEVAVQSELGKKAKEFMDRGELVPDALVVKMIASRLQKDFVLDGFPRSIGQAEALEKVLAEKKSLIDFVLNIVVSDETVVSRLGRRLVCGNCKAVFKEGVAKCGECGGALVKRKDDNPETIRDRLRVYREKTKPLEDYYEKTGLLKNIDGEGSSEEVFERIKKVLGKD